MFDSILLKENPIFCKLKSVKNVWFLGLIVILMCFIFKVSTCFKRLNGKINCADIEFQLRLERIRARLEEHKKDTLTELITNIHDNFKRYVEEERKKGNKGDAPIFLQQFC